MQLDLHMHLPLRRGWRYWRHRLAHWFQLEPCQLREVREGGRVVVLLCLDCGQIMTLTAKEKR